jgi:hypothetical protein
MATLDLSREPLRYTLDHATEGPIVLEIAPPTMSDVVDTPGGYAANAKYWMTKVHGWYQVCHQNGKPIKFTRENLEVLFARYRPYFDQFLKIMIELYFPKEESLGNSESPPDASGAAASTETTSETPSEG